MRKRLRFGIMTIVVLLLSAVGLLVGRSLWSQRQKDLAQQGLEFLPGVSQHIRDFHRVKIQNGKKVWEISALDAQYFQEDNIVVVREARMELSMRDGRTIGLKGDEARIELDERDVKRVVLRGAIEMKTSDYMVRTDQATYDHVREIISAPGAVEISGRALQLRGDQMEVNVDSERVTLLHNVAMHLEPALLPQGGSDAPL
jgi:LPS export ABC transporter protein LptC